MRRCLLLLLGLLAAVPLSAQERPMAVSTLTTTDTGATSVCVGCAVGASTATGTIKVGTVTATTINGATLSGVFTGTPSFSGVFTDTGFGTNQFTGGGTGGNLLQLQNTTAGTGNFAAMLILNDASKSVRLDSFSSTWTTATDAVANGARLVANGAGGLSITASDAAGVMRFYTGGTTLRWGINAAGDLTIGTSSNIALSNGTPTTVGTGGSGNPLVTGTDYAFSTSGKSNTTTTVTFGHTYGTAPQIIGIYNNIAGTPELLVISSVSTSGFTFARTGGGAMTLASTFHVFGS